MSSHPVLRLVAPFQLELVECVRDGWRAWRAGDYPPRRNATLRATVVNAWIWAAAEKRLRPYGLERVEEGGQPFMALDSSMRLRFKKMDPLGDSANVLTRQQRNLRKFGAPTEQLSFELSAFGLVSTNETIYTEVGYVLDPAEEQVDRVLLVTRGRSGWTHELWVAGRGTANGTSAVPQAAPAAPPAAAWLKPQPAPEKKDSSKKDQSE